MVGARKRCLDNTLSPMRFNPQEGKASTVEKREDGRLTRAKKILEDWGQGDEYLAVIIEDLLVYLEERMRVNVGLLAENKQLKSELQEIHEGKAASDV